MNPRDSANYRCLVNIFEKEAFSFGDSVRQDTISRSKVQDFKAWKVVEVLLNVFEVAKILFLS